MWSMFLAALVLMTGVMSAAILTQRRTGNAGWIDVYWTFGTGAACVLAALWPSAPTNALRAYLVAALAALWAGRLGLYLGFRVARSDKEDSRYARLRGEWGGAFPQRLSRLALIQAPTTALLSLSVYAATHHSALPLETRDILGALVLLVAIGGEALADEQMRAFKADAPPQAIMDRGLWAWSRHPNYFFQWLGWCAYPVIALDAAQPLTWLTLLAPALMYLVLRHATGVHMTEETMLQSRGEPFRAYQARVAVFFPRPPKRSVT
jgi:steroid 5-alpha reductase family enzyme